MNAFEEDALQSGRHAGLVVRWTKGLEQLVIARGSNVAYGARPLRRAVQRLFEDPLAEFLVAGELRQGGEVVLDVEQEEVVVRRGGTVLWRRQRQVRGPCAAAVLHCQGGAFSCWQGSLV